MYNSIHSKFIKTPILKILEDGVNACNGVGRDMEAYPLYEYIMQAIYLKITGAQEQKLKCINWEMATHDYEFRRIYPDKIKNDYGEFSQYDQKNNIYKQLLKEIERYNPAFDINTIKNGVVEETRKSIIQLLESSLLSKGNLPDYRFWKKDKKVMKDTQYANNQNLLESVALKLYKDDVIRHRHRCAHNLTSYQDNLPTLDTLAKEEYVYHNYYFRIAILAIIDEIFIRMYKEYIHQLEMSLYL